MTQQEASLAQARIEQLANWAAEDGDPDVLGVCQLALEGDVAMHAEALEWWEEWARVRQADGWRIE